ncbi:hypothetical protein AGABI2DRAFT_122390 [Agaricus bisporus var. bisporus H97]|uniref:hypothetical protein n=1 Tax=Agaricus bisporus var. bisporus (strain H97 / ATCC MYA-4626 / FGSC 10389) TaxID=936046 RepID=UPI00029F7450|nr:hypothetical protein AGABI2DRAFT_122390 [Agaricus bisporus var. bisporus H97]EKV42805.1 hypothetical protein AGABI2DRAFT_122390 [Agaricus bisporus var. bisporus H97]
MIPDLPAELWIKILSYLPPCSARNLLGVNRLFFDYAMDTLHWRFDLTEANGHTLAQLQHGAVGYTLYTKAGYLVPLLLPSGLPYPTACLPQNPFTFESLLLEIMLRKRYPINSHGSSTSPASTRSYLPRPVIRKLSINATVHKVNELLESHLAALSPFPGLEYLDLKLAASHDFFMEEDLDDLCDAITTFIKSNKQSLRTLIFADPAFIDVSNVFRDLGCLPSLKRLELSIPMLLSTLPRFEYLENFLTLNASTLECLVLKCRRFLLPDDTTQQFLFDVLPRLSLPVLSEFDIGIYSYTKPRVPFHLPSFVHFAPNIKTLKIQFSPNYLNEEDITNLLRNLSEYGLGLRSLHIQVQDLTPDLFLHISSSLPGLTSLRITYAQPRFDGWETVHQKAERSAFCAQFENRRFAPWSLKYLKLTHRSPCQEGHPDRLVCEAVAACIPELEVMDDTRSCRCGCMPAKGGLGL